jgi:ABC-2 type transport system ATP-binding protein
MSDILEVKNISKNYATHQALKNVSLSIPHQTIFGLLGPNGAGKTSLIRIITQIISKDGGEIFFDGKPLAPEHIGQIGYLPEERGLYKKMKVGEQLLYLSQLKGLNKKEAMHRLKEWFVKFDIKTWWDKNIEDLSKGMQQKIQFVATVLHEPKLIILDEPFSGFDPVNANLIKDEILELRRKGSTIIFSTHRMESVEELCDHIALINKSEKILDGPKKQVKDQFKSNIFRLEYRGRLNTSNAYTILAQEKLDDNYYQANLKAADGMSPNQLLQELMPQVEISAFQERLPSMNDIFITLVTGKNPAESLQEPQINTDVEI